MMNHKYEPVSLSLRILVQGCGDLLFYGKPGLTMAFPPYLVPWGHLWVDASWPATLAVLGSNGLTCSSLFVEVNPLLDARSPA